MTTQERRRLRGLGDEGRLMLEAYENYVRYGRYDDSYRFIALSAGEKDKLARRSPSDVWALAHNIVRQNAGFYGNFS